MKKFREKKKWNWNLRRRGRWITRLTNWIANSFKYLTKKFIAGHRQKRRYAIAPRKLIHSLPGTSNFWYFWMICQYAHRLKALMNTSYGLLGRPQLPESAKKPLQSPLVQRPESTIDTVMFAVHSVQYIGAHCWALLGDLHTYSICWLECSSGNLHKLIPVH